MWPRDSFSVGVLSKKQRTQIDSSFDAAKIQLVTQSGHGALVLASKVPKATLVDSASACGRLDLSPFH